jgi:hypothetical protein
MLENSFGLNFFLKTPRKKTNIRYIYLRITVEESQKKLRSKELGTVNVGIVKKKGQAGIRKTQG